MIKLLSPNLIKDQDWYYIDIFLPMFLPSLDTKNNFQPVTLPPLTTGVTLRKATVTVQNENTLTTSNRSIDSTLAPGPNQKSTTSRASVFDLLASIENNLASKQLPTNSKPLATTTRRMQTTVDNMPNVEASIFNLLSFLQNNATTRAYLSTLIGSSGGFTRSSTLPDQYRYPTLRPFDEPRHSPAKNFLGVILPNQNMTKIEFDRQVEYLAPRPIYKNSNKTIGKARCK
jgi:hypothetical protein